MDYNGSAGVQHIALNTTNIIETVSTLYEYTTFHVFFEIVEKGILQKHI